MWERRCLRPRLIEDESGRRRRPEVITKEEKKGKKKVKIKIPTKQEEENWKRIICCQSKNAYVTIIWVVIS